MNTAICDPLDLIIAEETAREIGAAFARLTPKQQTVLALLYEEGWNPRQVAKLLGISRSGLYLIRGRAISRLRRAIKPFM